MRVIVVTVQAACLVLAAGSANAGQAGYECTVAAETQLRADGKLAPYPKPLTVGARFFVDRTSGAFVQRTLAFWMSSRSTTQVLALGNRENGFVATYSTPAAGSGVFFSTLYVREHEPGPLKPFLLTDNGSVHSGTCE